VKRRFPLTPAQLKALDAQRNIAVMASAGSGKTATLVERYIELMHRHPSIGVRNILAITFTQKAAAEMRERVGDRLREAIEAAETSSEREHMLKLLDDLPAARISTIHAFCAALLREFPLEAGVDPTFSVLEEVDAETLRLQTLRQTLELLARRPDDDTDKKALGRLLGEWDRRYLDGVLGSLLLKRRLALKWSHYYSQQTPEQIYTTWEEKAAQTQEPACAALLADSDFLHALKALSTYKAARAPESDSAEQRLAPVRAAMQALSTNPTQAMAQRILPKLCAALLKADGTLYSTTRLGKKANWDPDELEKMRDAFAAVGQKLLEHAEVLQFAPGPADRRAAEVAHALSRVFLRVEARYLQAKGEGARLDFDDLQERALSLLEQSPAVAAQLAQQYRFVMVDEFQDTDPLQWDLIRPLVSTPTGELAADKLFVVGDPKQSIYSFREADVAVFYAVRAAMVATNRAHSSEERAFYEGPNALTSDKTERGGALYMRENFRTLAAPVDFVNHLFPRFMREVEGEPYQVGYDPLVCRRADDGVGSVELLLAPQHEGEEEAESLQREAEMMARRIRSLLDGDDLKVSDKEGLRAPHPGDIAILLRRRRNLGLYEHALRSYAIPFQVVGGLGFYQRQEVCDLANILRLLYNSSDGIALLGVLRSPYFGLSDAAIYQLTAPHGRDLWSALHDEKRRATLDEGDRSAAADAVRLLANWQQLRDRIPLIELLHAILLDTGAWGFLSSGERGAQNTANMRKLLDLARSADLPLADFVERLDLLTTEADKEGEAALDAQSGSVHVLTVHASKGLEYPIVFVPDLDGPFNLRTSDAALIDAEHGIGLTVLDPQAGFKRSPSLVRQLITDGYRRRGLAEEKRLFYVACTRARDHLVLCGRLREDHLADHAFAAAKDRLFWVCRGLELSAKELQAREISFQGADHRHILRIYTGPDQLETKSPQQLDQPPTISAMPPPALDAPEQWPPPLATLQPLTDANTLTECSATELALFACDRQLHHQQYLLGMPPWPIEEPQGARRRALHLDLLARTTLGRWGGDSESLIDYALGTHPAPATGWHSDLRRELGDILEIFRTSPYANCAQHPDSRRGNRFTLQLNNGIVHAVIDLLHCDSDDHWQLLTYKTATPNDIQEAVDYRQLQIYALCLQQLYPQQTHYSTTIYYATSGQHKNFTFDLGQLAAARREFDDLMAQLIQEHSR
jgi:ATP-dependent helicase/nuclease subunit A